MQRQGGASGFLLALFLVELRRQLLVRDEAGIPDYTLALALVELQFRGRFFVQGQEGFSAFIVKVVVAINLRAHLLLRILVGRQRQLVTLVLAELQRQQ